MAQTELDCRGINCPMPIVRVSRAVKDIAIGDTLAVTADDPSFQADIQAWIRMSGHLLQGLTADGPTSTAVIERRK